LKTRNTDSIQNYIATIKIPFTQNIILHIRTTSHGLIVQEPPKEMIKLARQLCAIVGKAQSKPSAQGRKDATGKWGVHCLVISPFEVAPPMLPAVITNNLRRKRASFGIRSSRCFLPT